MSFLRKLGFSESFVYILSGQVDILCPDRGFPLKFGSIEYLCRITLIP